MNDLMHRSAFESWISDPLEGAAFFGKPNFRVDGENEYLDPDVYGAWIAWQAALRLVRYQERES